MSILLYTHFMFSDSFPTFIYPVIINRKAQTTKLFNARHPNVFLMTINAYKLQSKH